MPFVPGMVGKPRKVDSPKKKKVEKPQDGHHEIMPKHRKSLPNGRQQKPQGGGAKRRPLGLGAAPKAPPCCLSFGKDFLSFASLPGPILGRFSEFVLNLVRVAIRTHPGFQIVVLYLREKTEPNTNPDKARISRISRNIARISRINKNCQYI